MSKFDRFIDPRTKQRLIYDSNNQTVHTANGEITYPIINGLPRFVPKELYDDIPDIATDEVQTGRSFGDMWRDPRHHTLGTTDADRRSLEEQFLAMLGCETLDELRHLFENAEATLNAGCGVAWSEYLFNINPQTERHCIDISLAVEVARKRTRDMPNVMVSQASILEVPYADNTFDIVYSCGVVHHTKDPKGAVMEIARKVKSGGLLGIYIYNKKPFIREMADQEIRKITTRLTYKECLPFSKEMTLLGKAFKCYTEPLVIEQDVELLGIKAGAYDLQKFIYDHFVKCWYDPAQDEIYSDLVNQDWYHPRYASHHSKEEVFGWITEAGFNNIKCLQPRGWEHSGYFISAQKF